MKVGDLVKDGGDGDLGIIIREVWTHLYVVRYVVEWSDGTSGYHSPSNLEVINESR